MFEVSHDAEPTDWTAPPAKLPAWSGPPQQPQRPQQQRRSLPRTVSPASAAPKAKIVDLDAERPLPSIERVISAPGGRRDLSWRRRVKVVAGGQGPGKRDQESLDRDRARLPLAPPPRRIIVLGCTRSLP
jgi:hypothetical protein